MSSIRPVLCRFQHTGSNSRKPDVHKSRISQHLTLRSVSKSPSKKSRDLVLFYEWLYPNAKALDKYCMLYHELGLDVLMIHGQLKHFISPSQSVKLSQEILDYLRNERNPKEDRYIAHTASIGAYNFRCHHYISLEVHVKSWPTGYNSQKFLLIWGLSLRGRCPNFL